MTEPVICHKGVCRYKKPQLNNDCVDCDEIQQIDKELLDE